MRFIKKTIHASQYPENPSWMEPASKNPASVIPIDHLQEFNGRNGQEQWSIQTEQTHGVKGLVKVSKSKLEDPAMSLKGDTPETTRRAGAENMFMGTKQGVTEFIKQNYPNTKRIEFK